MLAGLSKSIQSGWYRPGGPNPLLLPFSWLYGRIMDFRRRLYAGGKLQIRESAVPVIVVGNITVGGTGKSPVVGWLAQQLVARGYQPGIVSRGYGGKHSGSPLLVTEDTEAAEVGDEPVMLARQTGLPVCVSRDRSAGVALLAEEGANVVISDDGLQHYRMARQVELAVVDGVLGYGNGCLLPAGPLRELPARLTEVDVVLVNGQSATIEGTVFELEPADPLQLSGIVSRPLSEFTGTRVWAVAGIGNPRRFYNMLTEAGIPVDEVEVPDHGECDLAKLVRQRRQPILMTYKDAVKYRVSDAPNAWYVPVNVRFEPGADEQLVDMIEQRLKNA